MSRSHATEVCGAIQPDWNLHLGTTRSGNPVRVNYFLRVTNVGDRLSPMMVAAVSGRPVRWYRGKEKPHLLAIGSLLSSATPKAFVWGTGLMHPRFGPGNAAPERLLALRGKLTHAELRRSIGPIPDIPLGDPGFLVNPPSGQFGRRQYDLGLAPHYVDANHPVIRALASQPGVLLLPATDPPDRYFEKLSSCRAVVSTSLHGLVFAEAFGIPNLWGQVSDEVEGDGFKFRDWFSLAERPQAKAVVLSEKDQANQIAERCELHDMRIDRKALANALHDNALDEVSDDPGPPRLYSIAQCRRRPLPVFVISFNRANAMRKAIESYLAFDTPVQIIVHDNGSTDPETLSTLSDLEHSGAIVRRGPSIRTPDDLNRVNETIKDYFARWAEPSRYVVTDCDIDLTEAPPETLDLFHYLLDRFNKPACVGPMLRIRDVPRTYPLYNHMMNRHIEQFWAKDPLWCETPWGRIACQHALIDSTFALYRAGKHFRRHQSALRLYEPYEARHLDWYPPVGDGFYRHQSSPEVSHWDNEEQFARFRGEKMRFTEYKVVRQKPDGNLEQVVEHIGDPHQATQS